MVSFNEYKNTFTPSYSYLATEQISTFSKIINEVSIFSAFTPRFVLKHELSFNYEITYMVFLIKHYKGDIYCSRPQYRVMR